MATKKKKLISQSKICDLNLEYNGKNWSIESLDKLRDEFDRMISCRPEMPLHPIDQLDDPRVKIVVAIAGSVPKINGSNATRTQLMEDGRAAAQAAHAVSKLKLSYVLWLCQQVHTNAYDYAQRVMDSPITTMVVKARDAEELKHIVRLAQEKSLHLAEFYDDNDRYYGTPAKQFTAVAIGPYTPEYFDGITDYLPLWKSVHDPVS